MMAKDEILNALRAQLGKQSEILFAYVFGSFLESDRYNDVDVAIFLEDGNLMRNDRWYDIRLASELEKAAGVAVDLVILNTAPDHLIHRISSGKVIVDKDPEGRVEFIVNAWKRYFDFRPKREAYLAELLEMYQRA